MAYYSDSQTEKKLTELEKTIYNNYQVAYAEMKETASSYFDKYKERYEKEYKAFEEGKYTEAQFKAWVQTQVARGEGYEKMADKLATRMVEADKVASAYINDATPSIYSLNHNYEAYRISQAEKIDLQLTDEQTAKELALGKNHTEFRTTSINPKRDYEWNSKKIHNALNSAILQGKSIDKLSDSFFSVMKSDRASAIRNARTSFTSAQNAGRLASYEQATEMGIKLQKEWIATKDDRTRDSHGDLDGTRVPYDEEFKTITGFTLMYPADPSGEPCEVYNCRCTMRAVLPNINDKPRETYSEWLERMTPEEKGEENNAIKQNLVKPVRPKKSDYENEEKYLEAREKYKEDKAIYEEKLKEYIESENNKPRKYDTQEKIEAWAKENNIRVDKSVYDHIDLRIMDDVISVQEEMLEKYPFIKEWQDGLYPYGIGYEGENTYIFNGTTGLNLGKCWEDYNSLTYSIDSLNDGTFNHGDGSIQTLLRHEFGHNVDDYIRMSKMNTLDLRGDDAETKIRSEMRKQYTKEIQELTKTYCKTEYAFTNENEAFAEGFAEYTSNPDSDYAKAFGKFLDKWL